jgi:hypothetical protein
MITGSVLIIVGVALLGWIMATEDERNVIEVYLEHGKTESLKFENLSLIPGGECEYKISLDSKYSKSYDITLGFREIEESALKDFAYVKIIANGETVCDELLATVLEGDNIVLPVDFTENKNTDLTIVYYLPIEVGNEAKNAEAIFELLLTAINE